MAASTSGYQFATLGVGLLGSILVARVLGPEQKGVVDVFNLIGAFITDIGLLGFGSGIFYYLANRKRPLGEIHGTTLRYSLTAGAVLMLIGLLGIRYWRSLFPGVETWIVLAAFFMSPIAFYQLVWSNIMTGINRVVTAYRIGFYLAVGNLVLVFLFYHLGLIRPPIIVLTSVFWSIVLFGIGFGLLKKEAPELRPSNELLGKCLRYGSVIYFGNLFNVLHFKVDQVMINMWLGTKALGEYALSVRWAEMLFYLDSGIMAAALYRISSSDAADSHRFSTKLFKFQLMVSGAGGLLLILVSGILIQFLYGDAYQNAVGPLRILVPGIVSWSASKYLAGMLSYNQKKGMVVTVSAGIGLLLNVVLNFVFIKHLGMGIRGAALASSISYMSVFCMVVYWAWVYRPKAAPGA